ncbi:FMN reductase [Ktedonobacter sp. SOSP1-52]|uniref:NADPH-dependent FMN reductase n=1 Tax=Ktedonobacter sp. SOSP1-52 TaxID=2778366 RepID=UPI001915D7F3|nr:NAD(P)H-dependent oxidoreductase [Ktedonobacter sp. SOSP1-52]GHO68313.1 FMN reductase [Ktedonobacter sp. SOSP1-52]
MLKVAIVVGSTRPNRNSEAVAHWVYDIAQKRGDAEVELLDLKEINLPLFDEPFSPLLNQYQHQHTKEWSAKIRPFDAFIFVTPEYNRAPSAVLKNAIDYLYYEWHNKAAGFVSYGANDGVRAVEHLRLVMGEIQVADVGQQVSLNLYSDFEDYTNFRPRPHQEQSVHTMLDQLLAWGGP